MKITLIAIFGLWINPVNIAYMRPVGNECKIVFTDQKSVTAPAKCHDVNEQIKKKLKE